MLTVWHMPVAYTTGKISGFMIICAESDFDLWVVYSVKLQCAVIVTELVGK